MFQASFKKTPLFLFDTLSRTKKKVESSKALQKPDSIQMYTCGPTVHDFAHIGNFRTFAFEDILRRTLKSLGYQLNHVMNITDVDDKTIRKATEKNLSLEEYTKPFTQAFFEDLSALGIESAESYPRATDYIQPMIAMIEQLIGKGYAYVGEDSSVYYAIDKFADYGKLSHLKLEDLTSHTCVSHENLKAKKQENKQERDEYDKENASDFVLWKAYDESRDGRVFWESPWGKGRPGWHLECSCMAMQLLGHELDIHAGGVDNIFPHHENEIAQSEALSSKPFSKLWVHSEHLLVDGKKMSKSLGNFYRLRDLLEKGFSGRQVRYQLIASHYRTQVNFTLEGLEAAKKSLSRIDALLERLESCEHFSEKGDSTRLDQEISQSLVVVFNAFIESLCDDLNTPQALAHLFELIRTLNVALDEKKMGAAGAKEALACIYKMDEVLGIIKPFKDMHKEASIPKAVQVLAEKRKSARLEKNWAEADRCRDELQALGFAVKDTPNSYTIEKL